MKIDKYLLEFEIGHLKTPIQAFCAKENDVVDQLRHKAISKKEKKISYKEYEYQYPQLIEYGLPYSPYKSVLNYYQNIQDDKWFLNYKYNTANHFTNFNILFIFGIIWACLLVFLLKKYKTFIERISKKEQKNNQFDETKKCPYCSEEILSTAKKCKYCHSKLDTFDFIKNTKFNKFVYCCIACLLGFSIFTNIVLFIYPIIIYLIFSILTFFDPLIVSLSLIFANIIFANIQNKFKVIATGFAFCLLAICFAFYSSYIANMWTIGRLTALLFTGICLNVYILKFFKKKYNTNFVFFFLYFIFTIFASCIISQFYEPIKAVGG